MFMFYTSRFTISKYSYIEVFVTMIIMLMMFQFTFTKVDSNKRRNTKNKIAFPRDFLWNLIWIESINLHESVSI